MSQKDINKKPGSLTHLDSDPHIRVSHINTHTKISRKSSLDQPGCMEQLDDDSVKGSKFVTGINLLKNTIGIGILTLPYAFKYSGWLAGTLFMVGVGYLSVYCCYVLMKLANQEQKKAEAKGQNFDPRNYQEFIEYMFQSKGWTYLINIMIFGGQLSDLIASCMFFTLYFQESFCYWEMEEFCSTRIPALVISLCIIFPLSFIRQFKSFKQFSIYGLGIVAISVVFIWFNGLKHIKNYPIDWVELEHFNIEQIPLSIGIFAAAYETFAVYFDLRYSMQEPEEFPQVYLNVTHIINAMYVACGTGGYLMYGPMTKDIILFNLPMANYLFVFIVFLYCVQLAITYSMHLFPLIIIGEMAFEDREPYHVQLQQQQEQEQQQIDDQESELLKQDDQNNKNQENNQLDNENNQEQQQQQETSIQNDEQHQQEMSNIEGQNGQIQDIVQEDEHHPYQWHWYSVFIRIGYTLFIFSVTLVFKQVSLFFGLFGALCGIPMMFIFPLIIWELKAEDKTTAQRIGHAIIIMIATFNMVVGVYQNGLEIGEHMSLSLYY